MGGGDITRLDHCQLFSRLLFSRLFKGDNVSVPLVRQIQQMEPAWLSLGWLMKGLGKMLVIIAIAGCLVPNSG